MAYSTFNFPYHSFRDIYPESSKIVSFGGGYQSATRPAGPDQIKVLLSFDAMWWFLNSNGTINYATNANRNIGALMQFYETVRMADCFYYPHPVRGTVVCRFTKPLEMPKIIKDANGMVEPFELELTIQPNLS